MKSTKLAVFTLALVAGAVGITSASAGNRDRAKAEERRIERFAKIDTDNNGSISAEEFDAAAKTRFERVDTDKNGQITRQEIEASLKKRHQRRAERMLKKADANSDGSISLEEMVSKRQDLFARLDKNKDGAIEKSEFRGPRRGAHRN